MDYFADLTSSRGFSHFEGAIAIRGVNTRSLRFLGKNVLTPAYVDSTGKRRGGSFICADVFGPNADGIGNHGNMRDVDWDIQAPTNYLGGISFEAHNVTSGILWIAQKQERIVTPGEEAVLETLIHASHIGSEHEDYTNHTTLVAPAEHPYTTITDIDRQKGLRELGVTTEALEQSDAILRTLEPGQEVTLVDGELEIGISSQNGSLAVFCFWRGPNGELCVEPTAAGPANTASVEQQQPHLLLPADTRTYNWSLRAARR